MIYYVRDWQKHFESGRSKTYKRLSHSWTPCKQGLGMKKLLRHKDGAAHLGAFHAIIDLLSRQEIQPRMGLLTTTGTFEGHPLTVEDISIATMIPEKWIQGMLDHCKSKCIGWIGVYTLTDTIGPDSVGAGTEFGYLDLDLDSYLNPHADVDVPSDEEAFKDGTPSCPHKKIIDLYLEILPELPGIARVQKNGELKYNWSGKRRTDLTARWKEDERRQNLEWWKSYFELVRTQPYLFGKNDRGWRASLEFLVRADKMTNVLEGKY